MIDWLMKNKEWLFSGLGLSTLGGLWTLVRRFGAKPKSEPSRAVVGTQAEGLSDMSAITLSKVDQASAITVDDIRTSIEEAPPMQRETVAQRYHGLRIEWDTQLSSAVEKNGVVELLLNTQQSRRYQLSYSVRCKVALEDYRELAVLPERANIRVNGTIERVSDYWLSLGNARLVLVPTKSDA